jgi:hypothetical protein
MKIGSGRRSQATMSKNSALRVAGGTRGVAYRGDILWLRMNRLAKVLLAELLDYRVIKSRTSHPSSKDLRSLMSMTLILFCAAQSESIFLDSDDRMSIETMTFRGRAAAPNLSSAGM